ncbi:disease resistance protein RPP5 isoform X2 [Cajanus cajan]|nr:disease resistance protein RPP5 isoform X2 [Cajanus cajan]
MIRTYDVFVSFRGEDTRNNFTSFLFHDLSRNGIVAFKDDTHLHKGESIAPELLQAIEGSRLFIVVFSKNYASSTWCLRELAHICNCIQTSQRCVLPIFYDVDPSDVRKQSGCYEKAFVEHEERFREDKEKMEEVQTWRESLTRVANLSGWDIQNKPQYVEIEEIIQKIKNIMGHKFSWLPKDNLVGMESRVETLSRILYLELVNDVRVVGISGMGGIGKTTLAYSLYERISEQYKFCCFIDVSKIYQASGTIGVQKQLLSQCLKEKNLEISNASEGTCLVWERLHHARALIVLDNVDQDRQLNMFTGNRETLLRECLGGGSRIIIVSRDKHILRKYGVDDVYQVQPLNDEDATQLFYKYAFKGNHIMTGYEELTYDILSHVQGHPLAIQVLGSSLFDRNISQWKSALVRFKENKSDNIIDFLRLGFDELDNLEKEIFLDIACFFNNEKEERVMEILDFREFHPEYGLQILAEKSLITVECGHIRMHDLLIDLGRCIAREKSPKEPIKWTRLWDYQDLHKVMSNNMESVNLEAIAVVDFLMEFDETTIRADALSKMSKLKFLKLEFVNFCGNLDHLSNELGYLRWGDYPFKSLPPSFQPDNLVELSLRVSNIKQLWKDRKHLPNLRHLDLAHSKNLIQIPDLGEAPNLRLLDLNGCKKLRQLHPSVGLLTKLTLLNLEKCKSLIKTPHFRENQILETLNLRGCRQLKEINPSIGLLQKLTFLDLDRCENLISLPNSILCLSSLEYLNLSRCPKLFNTQLLHEARDEEQMKKLCIGESPICSHSTSSIMKKWFKSPLHLLHSRARKGPVSRLLPSSPTLGCMRELHLNFCNLVQIPDAIGNLHLLESLCLRENNFATLPSLKELWKLYSLNLQDCRQLKYFPELPSRTDLSSERYQLPEYLNRDLYDIREHLRVEVYKYKKAGLNIYGCPELVDLERCTSMAFSWTRQILEAHYQYKRPCLSYNDVFPLHIASIIRGSEIPSWFNNDHEGIGSLITLDESPLMQKDNNCIGLACCVVFGPPSRIMAPPKTESVRRFRAEIPLFLGEDQVTEDHLWLFYYALPQSLLTCWDAHFKLEIEITNIGSWTFEVKKYGYRWVYEKPLEVSNLIMMHNPNS